MALILLIVIGSTLGWFASIVTRHEDSGAILSFMGVGVLAALVAGVIANNGAFLGGLSLLALAVSIVAAIIALAGYHIFFRRRAANG